MTLHRQLYLDTLQGHHKLLQSAIGHSPPVGLLVGPKVGESVGASDGACQHQAYPQSGRQVHDSQAIPAFHGDYRPLWLLDSPVLLTLLGLLLGASLGEAVGRVGLAVG